MSLTIVDADDHLSDCCSVHNEVEQETRIDDMDSSDDAEISEFMSCCDKPALCGNRSASNSNEQGDNLTCNANQSFSQNEEPLHGFLQNPIAPELTTNYQPGATAMPPRSDHQQTNYGVPIQYQPYVPTGKVRPTSPQQYPVIPLNPKINASETLAVYKNLAPYCQSPDKKKEIRKALYNQNDGDLDRCPTCGRPVFHAEKLVALGQNWHVKCFICASCFRTLPGSDFCSHAGYPFCARCYTQEMATVRHEPKSHLLENRHEGVDKSDPDMCPACGRKVFFAERIIFKDRFWHHICLKCTQCYKVLEGIAVHDFQGKPFCSRCYRCMSAKRMMDEARKSKAWWMKGQLIAEEDRDVEDASRCPYCGLKVYHAEAMFIAGRNWHQSCIRCENCDRKLGRNEIGTYKNNLVVCKTCMKSQTSQQNTMQSQAQSSGSKLRKSSPGVACNGCKQPVFHAEAVLAVGGTYHRQCLKCSKCGKSLSANMALEHNKKPFCKTCHQRYALLDDRGKSQKNQSKTDAKSVHLKNAPACLQCGESVFHAERVTAMGGIYHKRCLRCSNCARILTNPGERVDHGSEPYCFPCHAQLFGIIGYGFSNGAAGLAKYRGFKQKEFLHPVTLKSSTDEISEDDGDNCPACGKKVYFAEQLIYQGKKYHTRCFKCASCMALLNLGGHCSKGDTPYCRPCYTRNFSSLSKHNEKLFYPPNGKASKKYHPLSCAACGYQAFQAEAIFFNDRRWHKQCLRCIMCDKILEPALCILFEKNCYCRMCYGKNCGPVGFGFAEGSMGPMYGREPDKSNLYGDTLWQPHVSGPPRPIKWVDPNLCPLCGSLVELADMKVISDIKWHKRCFKCVNCCQQVKLKEAQLYDRSLFCRGCYLNIFQIGNHMCWS